MRRFAVTMLGGFTLLCLAWAVASAAQGGYWTAVVATCFAAWWFLALAVWIIMPKAVAHGSYDETGTTLRPDRRIERLGMLLVLVGIPVIAAFAVLALSDRLVIPVPSVFAEVSREVLHMYGFCFAAVIVVLVFVWWSTHRNGGIAWLRMTPDGFAFVEGFQGAHGRWADVTSVTDRAPHQPRASSPLVMVMSDGGKAVIQSSSIYAGPHGRAVLELVRFYWQNPDCRAELTDGRALERLRSN